MRLLVCGSRSWKDRMLMMEVLRKIKRKQDNYKGIVTLIHGAASGADEMAGEIGAQFAISSCWRVKAYPANWKKYGKAAGPIRNQRMLEKEMLGTGENRLVLAFHENIRSSKGTKDMILRALEHGIRVRLYPRKKRKAR